MAVEEGHVIKASLPYYVVRATWEGGEADLIVESLVMPRLPLLLRASLLSTMIPGVSQVPEPGFPPLEGYPWEVVSESLAESLAAILARGRDAGPPFEFEGLKGLIKAIVTLGRYKPYRPTESLTLRAAYAYVHDVLGITSVPALRLKGRAYRSFRIHLSPSPPGAPVLFEAWTGSGWTVDRVLTRLARENPEALAELSRQLAGLV